MQKYNFVHSSVWIRNSTSFTLKEGYNLRMLVDGVLRIIFEPKGNKTVRDWREFRIEELHNIHSSPKSIRQSSYGV
jgi:hypothetical protein